jgi:hypothetical protein
MFRKASDLDRLFLNDLSNGKSITVIFIENIGRQIANCKLGFMGVQTVRWDAEDSTNSELKHKPLKIAKILYRRKHIELQFFKIRSRMERP